MLGIPKRIVMFSYIFGDCIDHSPVHLIDMIIVSIGELAHHEVRLTSVGGDLLRLGLYISLLNVAIVRE